MSVMRAPLTTKPLERHRQLLKTTGVEPLRREVAGYGERSSVSALLARNWRASSYLQEFYSECRLPEPAHFAPPVTWTSGLSLALEGQRGAPP
jgi:hypothetical protein